MSNTRGNWASAAAQAAANANTTAGEAEVAQSTATPLMSPAAAYRSAHDAVAELQHGLHGYEQQVSRVVQHIKNLTNVIETLRQHYDAVVEERDYMNRSLEAAEGRLLDVQRVVQRYAAVTDPVVASDGFTYEREVITKYLNECQTLKNVPMSQQTHKELTMLLFPNRSFKRFLEQLMETRPADMRTDVLGSSGHGNNTNNSINNSNNSNTNNSITASGRAGVNGHHNHKGETGNKGASLAAAAAAGGGVSGSSSGGERLHPCVRVYGYCNYKDTCAYALYPYDACLSHLKGKCRFRSQCHERHVDFRGPMNHTQQNGDGRGPASNAVA
ncbi:RNA-binding protein [Trypanosoma theileri]|uniref:RNA-binding protein n=1 Tax=Trypanosoma theileri TaxID=67003 RepID=A0A1X0P6E1_9TRYP|nr:RNA-binding protein [Trypanosoma theileri]ORC92502.1 RNA-binding protein [Trypanosoma theileri]